MPKKPLKPYWRTRDRSVSLYQGEVCDVLERLPAQSVHCVVTSPPYWGLRDYGTGVWEGGDADCDHTPDRTSPSSTLEGGKTTQGMARVFLRRCGKCGAKRVDQQIGSEPSPDCGTQGQAQCGQCFVCSMIKVFRSVWKVLRNDGACWLNLGDTYSSGCMTGKRGPNSKFGNSSRGHAHDHNKLPPRKTEGLKGGNLVGVPWRVALALQADGWVLRQDIVWAKPSPMPESVRNRCTKSHEYIFLLTKSMKYWYDAEAVKDQSINNWNSAHSSFAKERPKFKSLEGDKRLHDLQRTQFSHNTHHPDVDHNKRNKRSVWTVSSESYGGAHFAVFPQKLIEPCILATCPAKCCAECGKPWQRVVGRTKLSRKRPNDYVKRSGQAGTGNSCANTVAGVAVETKGWAPGCECEAGHAKGIALDPFMGSGTTACVALRHGRRAIGVDLSEPYLREQAVPRIEGVITSIPSLRRALLAKPSKLQGKGLLG